MSVLHVRDIDTMSMCSWSSGRGMSFAEPSGGMGFSGENPRSIATQSSMQSSYKYPIKTLCFAKKSLMMPTKEEYSLLLKWGLGARKWHVSLSCDEQAFESAIYKIYPRLSSVSGYTLWNINTDKSFEELPAKVNTPSRIKEYVGKQFTGCLLIMPIKEIQVGSEEMVEGETKNSAETNKGNMPMVNETLLGAGVTSSSRMTVEAAAAPKRHHEEGIIPKESSPKKVGFSPCPPAHRREFRPPETARSLRRAFCMVCGRVPYHQPIPLGLQDIESATLPAGNSENGSLSVSQRLGEIIRITESQRSQLVSSKQICKKCLGQLAEINSMENQIKRAKEEMMGTFLTTVSKVSEQYSREMLSSTSESRNPYPPTQSTSMSPPPVSAPRSVDVEINNRNHFDHTGPQYRFAISGPSNITTVTNSRSWETASNLHPEQMRKQLENRRRNSRPGNLLVNRRNQNDYKPLTPIKTKSKLHTEPEAEQRLATSWPIELTSHLPILRSPVPTQHPSLIMNSTDAHYTENPSAPNYAASDDSSSDMPSIKSDDSHPTYRHYISSSPPKMDVGPGPNVYPTPPRYYNALDVNNVGNQRNHEENNMSCLASSIEEKPTNLYVTCGPTITTTTAWAASRCTSRLQGSDYCGKKNNLITHGNHSDKEAQDMTFERANKQLIRPENRNLLNIRPHVEEGPTLAPPVNIDSLKKRGNQNINSNHQYEMVRSFTNLDGGTRGIETEPGSRLNDNEETDNSAEHVGDLWKQNQRVRRSPIRLVRSIAEELDKPDSVWKIKTSQRNETENCVKGEERPSRGNSNDGNINNSGECSRSSSITPSPPVSMNSTGSMDQCLSSDACTDDFQTKALNVSQPFWKKRYCGDSSDLYAQQTHEKSLPSITINGAKADKIDTASDDRTCISTDEDQHQRKRRKVHHYIKNTAPFIGNNAGYISRNNSKKPTVKSLSADEASNVITTDSGHDSRLSD